MLRFLPKVDQVLNILQDEAPHILKLKAARLAIDEVRKNILSGKLSASKQELRDLVLSNAKKHLNRLNRPSLRRVINATGVIVHTNLGRSLLPKEAIDNIIEVSTSYSNLEYNLDAGKRGIRYSHVVELLCDLTGAESALVVNNNAAAVLISLETLAKNKEVIVSRGELVEIGGSFRIPDVMAKSGAILREVGTTNRTHLKDYRNAIHENTAMLLKVHQSNYKILGFTKAVDMEELVELAKEYGLYVMEDLGSGNFVDFSQFGLEYEPTVQEVVKKGVDVVTFSGDKMLGGPQAGIILGKKDIIDKIKMNPLNRAVRIDKLTLAALESVLRIYLEPDKAIKHIPTLNTICLDFDEVKKRARRLARGLKRIIPNFLGLKIVETTSRVGGGALPICPIKSLAVSIYYKDVPKDTKVPKTISELEKILRKTDPPIITRIEEDALLFDVRTLIDRDYKDIIKILKTIFNL